MIEEDRKDFLFDPDCLSCIENLRQERLYTFDEINKLKNELNELRSFFASEKIKIPSNEKLVDEISRLNLRMKEMQTVYRNVVKGFKERLEFFSQMSSYIRKNNVLTNKLHYVERSLGLIANHFELPSNIKKNLLEYLEKDAYYREFIKSENEAIKLRGGDLSLLEFDSSEEKIVFKKSEENNSFNILFNNNEEIIALNKQINENKEKICEISKKIMFNIRDKKINESNNEKENIIENIKSMFKI